MKDPLVSISIPFFEEPHIFETIISLQNQTLVNFVCFINDDCSNLKYQNQILNKISQDNRFRYLRTPVNKGGWENTKSCINFHRSQITSKYSFELGHHDIISPEYLESCVNFLEANPEYGTCTGKMLSFTESISSSDERPGTEYEFFGEAGLKPFLLSVPVLYDCTIYNAVYRTEILKSIPYLPFVENPMIRFDHLVISLRSALGKTKVLSNVNYYRRNQTIDTRPSFVERQSTNISIKELNANFILGYIRLFENLFENKMELGAFLHARSLIFDCLIKRFANGNIG
jgi:glycosyltransferase involved in cell wall biosynthesis